MKQHIDNNLTECSINEYTGGNLTKNIYISMQQNLDSLIRRGNIALEDSDWSKAEQLFNQALDVEAQSAEAYLGLAMVKSQSTTWSELQNYIILNAHTEIKEIEHAKKYAEAELLTQLQLLDELKKEWDSIAILKRERFKTASCLFASSGAYNYNLILYPNGRCNMNWDNWGWTDIIAIASGEDTSCCLKSDGSVLWGGNNVGWRNIIAISMMPCPDICSGPHEHLVGLKGDGTVVAAGINTDERCNVANWTNIIAISAGRYHTVGLKGDGTVVATGNNSEGQCDVSNWKDIVSISAGVSHTVGLKADGTVIATRYRGKYYNGQCDVYQWTDIVGISANLAYTVGLKADGTVVVTNYIKDADGYSHDEGQFNIASWKDIVAVFACGFHTVGIKSDGTMVAVGRNHGGQCNLSGYKLFDNLDELVKKHQTIHEFLTQKEFELQRKEKQLKIAQQQQLKNEQVILQTELTNLKGIFTGRRRKEIQIRLMQIDTELKNL